MRHRRSNGPTLALLLGVALTAAGCTGSDGILGPNEGRVRFVLSSSSAVVAGDVAAAPALNGGGEDGENLEDRNDGHRFFESANVTLSSVLARNLDGVLVNVDMDLPAMVDILAMDGRRGIELDGVLPADTYDQVVVVMTTLQGVTHDGTTITIEPPGGGWTAIVPVCPFVVGDGETTTLALTLALRNSFSWQGNKYHFQPRFVCSQPEEPPVDAAPVL